MQIVMLQPCTSRPQKIILRLPWGNFDIIEKGYLTVNLWKRYTSGNAHQFLMNRLEVINFYQNDTCVLTSLSCHGYISKI